ncbi:hypothetical protein JCM10207_007380 [Rhodosporidiobolus poonsookiae]
MPNPPPPPPPPHSNAPAGFRKFPLIQTPGPEAPMVTVASGSGPIAPQELAQLRTSLILSRVLAQERLSVKEGNKQHLADRVRASEEQTRVRDSERRRKREEDERKERERAEKAEKERVEREREERRRAKQAEKEDAERRAREAAGAVDKKKALDVISIVSANEASRRKSNGVAAGDGDTVMADGTPSGNTTAPSSAFPTPVPSKAPSPDVDDDSSQPKPPRHHDKKKRKREQVIDSDASDSEADSQPLLQKVRKLDSQPSSSAAPSPYANTPITHALPPPPPQPSGPSLVERKLKEERFQKHSIPIKPPPPGGASAFFVPSNSLVPPKPPVVPPVPTPKRQADVSGDFSVAKPGQQIAHSTFQNWVDAYLRPFGEDDLAFLAPKPDDITPYLIPPLGKHYLDKWEEEDGDTPAASSSSYISPLEPPVLPRLRPDSLTEDALATENVFLGPLSERLMAALAVDDGAFGELDEDDEDVPRGDEDAPVPPRLPMDAVDLEERIKRELRFIGILPEEEPDWSTREDDEISSALRACQRLLHEQAELNEARKAVLMGLVKDRMAYQDYETARDAQERVIETGWTKRQKTDSKKQKKKKDRDRRQGDRAGKDAAGGGGAGDDPSKLPIPHELLDAVEKRARLVQAFEPFFAEEEQGRYFGLPEKSVYEGVRVGEEDDEDEEGAQGAGASHQQQIQ